MKKVILILLVMFAVMTVFGCAQKQSQEVPLKSVPADKVVAETGDIGDMTDVSEGVEEDVADAEENYVESVHQDTLPISEDDLAALNAEIESMEFDDLTGLSD